MERKTIPETYSSYIENNRQLAERTKIDLLVDAWGSDIQERIVQCQSHEQLPPGRRLAASS